jgi:hypothetical protein
MRYYRSNLWPGLYASFERDSNNTYSGHVIFDCFCTNAVLTYAAGAKISTNNLIDWEDVTPEVGQVYIKDGIEYKLVELGDQEVYLAYFDEEYVVSPTYVEFFGWWKLGSEIDDDPSYTEGYRAGYSGLRWL